MIEACTTHVTETSDENNAIVAGSQGLGGAEGCRRVTRRFPWQKRLEKCKAEQLENTFKRKPYLQKRGPENKFFQKQERPLSYRNKMREIRNNGRKTRHF